jgi:glycosyltransferase involved in cell wall biosynthesis
MRVAMVILEYHPVLGGAQRQLESVAPLLQERGVEVHVLTRAVEGWPREQQIDGVRVHRIPAPGPKAVASLVFTALSLARLRSLRPDVVHAYSLFSPATIAMLARARLGIPAVVKLLRGGIGGDVERLRRKTLGGARIKRLRRYMDRFLSISSEIDDELEGLGIIAERRLSIPNGVDTERFRRPAPERRTALREELGLPGVAPVAVYCGRLVTEKRVDLLLDAWTIVREKVPGALLCIVGDGPERAALQARAGEGVRFEGMLADVAPTLAAADLFVLPSEAEGLSNALLEAASSALPIVATHVGGAIDVVEHGQSGLLVEPNDTGALADALIRVLEDPERSRLGDRARDGVLTAYSLELVADRLRDLYAEVVRRAPVQAPVAPMAECVEERVPSRPLRRPPCEPSARVER